jgi:bifunctional non-homologous end joining protein LigD
MSAMPSEATTVRIEGRELRLTNLEKVLYPAAGFTKGQVIDYYAQIGPVIVAHLAGRPLTLKRYPNGVDAGHFYEKQCPSHRPKWMSIASIPSGRIARGHVDYCVVDSLPGLVWVANLASLELHTLLATGDDPYRPTMMVFDLDPGPPAGIIECCRVALQLQDAFARLELKAFPKTSGSKGMQLYVPLNTPGATYDATKGFARQLAELLERVHPDLVTSNMRKDLRPGKVFIDWSQNDEHKTTVGVYSLRAMARPTVSTPISWDEVDDALTSGDADRLRFEVGDVLERVRRVGDLFLPVLTLRQELPGTGAATGGGPVE